MNVFNSHVSHSQRVWHDTTGQPGAGPGHDGRAVHGCAAESHCRALRGVLQGPGRNGGLEQLPSGKLT